ncbi:MAG: tetratricopeptide repeat protein [Vicinamibacterales bacterium]
MKTTHTIGAAVLLGASVAVFQVGAFASGSAVPSAPAGPSMPNRSPEEMAIASYNSGIDHKDKGVKLEAAAASVANPKDRAKADDKAKKEYEKALKDFKSAASGSPQMYQAYNGMGFSYRKTGDYLKALEMYDRALTLKPGFPDAIEYRGEAYLGLNRVEDAKNAYLEVLAADRKQANTLMAAMQQWIEQKKSNPAGVDPAVVTGLEGWVKGRAELARETAAMGLSHGPRW